MSRRLPALLALRTFEAAARHRSFTKAGGELAVTPAAVSHQVRALEEQLGVRLFWRTTRAVRLTRAGEVLSRAVADGLGIVAAAVEQIRESEGDRSLTVTAGPSFAAKWLVPRLDEFRRAHPGVDVRIDVSERLADFRRGEADVGVRFGHGAYAGLRADRLFDEAVFPVCSPKLLGGAHPLRQPRDLARHTLIHVEWDGQGETWPDWRMWLRAAGASDVNPLRGLHFSQDSLAIQAALDGQGVALGNTTLVADDLASGRLVQPFELALKGPAHFAYYIVAPKGTADAPLIKAFREWLLEEARATNQRDGTGPG